MGIFNIGKKSQPIQSSAQQAAPVSSADSAKLAEVALKTIQDGILIVNKDGVIRFINPAAAKMIGADKIDDVLNLGYELVMKLEKNDGEKVDEEKNEFAQAVKTNQDFESRDFVLVAKQTDKKTPIALRMTPSGDARADRIITFRNIAKELEEEGAQTEFISTASHEMRTPVASIEGYLGLALNPQTATIDARARQYLESAHNASQHLGNLFRDLLDVTKLDDKRIHAHLTPLELTGFVKKFADEYIPKFREKNINYSFGAESQKSKRFSGGKSIEQVVYTFADVDFLGEILANLIENAIKYTPEGGAIWVNVQGDGDKALVNVTDTGIGIAAEDLQHIFQKFYRADNSQTRTVGGTGLGLYLVKQRVEAMAGRVWAESAFGEGSTFYVSLPRLTSEEYEKRQIAEQNKKAVQAFAEKDLQANVEANAAGATVGSADIVTMGPSFKPDVLNQPAPVIQMPVAPQPAPAAPTPEAPASAPVASQPVPLQPVPLTPQPIPPQPAPTQPTPQATPMVLPNSLLRQAQASAYQSGATPAVGAAPTLQPAQPLTPPIVSASAQPVAQNTPQMPAQPVAQPAQPVQPVQTATTTPVNPAGQTPTQSIQTNQNIIQ